MLFNNCIYYFYFLAAFHLEESKAFAPFPWLNILPQGENVVFQIKIYR